jgi:uncharacterized protein YqcC (DUF446 family)
VRCLCLPDLLTALLTPEGEQLVTLLQGLERELRKNSLWGTASPNHDALESAAPFACDKMNIFEWLQWICVPRLHDVAGDRRNCLPVTSEITTAAEIYLQNEGRVAPNLLNLVRALDDELNARWVSS